jgi:hypothetical protein
VAYDEFCKVLDCSKVVKAILSCPLDQILKRIDRRNSADNPVGRTVFLAFQQFVQMYKLQTSLEELARMWARRNQKAGRRRRARKS